MAYFKHVAPSFERVAASSKRAAASFKRVAPSFKPVAAFSKVQQHGEVSIINFTFILILFLLVFSDAIHSFSVSINHLLCFYISAF